MRNLFALFFVFSSVRSLEITLRIRPSSQDALTTSSQPRQSMSQNMKLTGFKLDHQRGARRWREEEALVWSASGGTEEEAKKSQRHVKENGNEY
jgi:hypothetical protein